MAYFLGVDLGTTYSAAAVSQDGASEIFPLGSRVPSIPSVVVLKEDGTLLVGEAAERRSVAEPLRTAQEFKRRLGDPTPILLGGTPYGAEALSAALLGGIVAEVSERQGGPPSLVVVTHPANYGPYKLGLLEEATRLADVGDVAFLTEPEAAALHYSETERVDVGAIVAVYDFGGGTFDAAVLRRTKAGFEILGAPEGMERFGGIDLDDAVFWHVRQALGAALQDLDTEDPAVTASLVKLRDECRAAKEALSEDTDTTIQVMLPHLHTQVRLTRAEFEDLIRPRLRDTLSSLERAIRSAGIGWEDLDRVLLVGGSSRIPLVGEMVRAASGKPVALDAHPKHTVALGAAQFASRAKPASAAAAVIEQAPIEEIPVGPSTPKATRPIPYRGGIAAAAVLAVVVASIFLLRNGGSDEPETAAATTAVTPVTTTAPAATTSTGSATSSAAVAVVTTSAVPASPEAKLFFAPSSTFIPPRPMLGSGGAAGSGCLDGEAALGDGIWFGYVTTTWQAGDEYGFDFDPACHFFGEPARQQAADDGAGAVNDTYIRNTDPTTMEIALSSTADVFSIRGEDDSYQTSKPPSDPEHLVVPFADWPTRSGGYLPCPGIFCGVWLYVRNGVAIQLVEQWVPTTAAGDWAWVCDSPSAPRECGDFSTDSSMIPPQPQGDAERRIAGDAAGFGCLAEGETLDDGIWFGYVDKKWQVGDERGVDFDSACLHYLDGAHRAAAEDGASVANDFYIRNIDTATVAVGIPATTDVFSIAGDGDEYLNGDVPSDGEFLVVEFADWPTQSAGYLPCPGASCGVWLYINGGVVDAVVEQWLPGASSSWESLCGLLSPPKECG